MNYFKKYITPEQEIFRNIQYLDPQCPPKEFKYRETEMTTIASKISPIFYDSVPIPTIILGGNATGKTTAIKKLFQELEETITEIITVYINCRKKYTEAPIYREIYKNVLNKEAPKHGYSNQNLFHDAMITLKENNQSLIIALDDINYLLGNDTHIASPIGQRIIQKLTRANEDYGVNIGIYPLLTSEEFKYQFDRDVQSTFIPTEVHFKPYSREEVFNIIKERCDYVFFKQIPDDVLMTITEEVLKDNNLRNAWNLLKKLGIRMKIEEKEPSIKLIKEVIEEEL